MSTATMNAPASPPAKFRLSGLHVLGIMVAFFGVIFAVNGVFLYQALSTYTGVVANEPYRKGLAYNDRIRDDERQQALGWKEDIAVSDSHDRLTLSLTTADGAPVTGLKIAGAIGRPASNAEDKPVALAETTPGTYVGALPTLASGNWQAKLETATATKDGEPIVYRMRKRLWLKP